MSQIVGIYTQQSSADAARHLLLEAGCLTERVVLLPPSRPASVVPYPRFRQRGESMVRLGLRWGVIGAIITEIPVIFLLFMVSIDVNVKVLLASTVWKFGGAFGAWLGVIVASERGLESDAASRYEAILDGGSWVLAADVEAKDRSYARGAMLESDATEVRDVRGTFEWRLPQAVGDRSLGG